MIEGYPDPDSSDLGSRALARDVGAKSAAILADSIKSVIGWFAFLSETSPTFIPFTEPDRLVYASRPERQTGSLQSDRFPNITG